MGNSLQQVALKDSVLKFQSGPRLELAEGVGMEKKVCLTIDGWDVP